MQALALFVGLLAAVAADKKEDSVTQRALELETKALAARSSITRGDVEYRVVRIQAGKPQRGLECHVTFDGSKVRTDAKQPFAARGAKSPASTVPVSKYVFLEETVLFYTDALTPEGKRIAVHQFAAKNPGAEGMKSFNINPRLFGVIPSDPGLLYGRGPESFLAKPDRAGTSLKNEKIGDIETWRIEYDRAKGLHVSIWIAPAQNYAVVRAAIRSTYQGQLLSDQIDSTNVQWGDSRLWFPREVRYERCLDGKPLSHSTLTVAKAQFNQAVDPKVFTLAGLDIAPNTLIVEYPPVPGPAVMWDGKGIVPYNPSLPR